MSNDHHKYAPSSLPRLFKCSGYPAMCEGKPELKDEYSGLGNALHESIEKADLSLLDNDDDKVLASDCLEALTAIAPIDRWKREIRLSLEHEGEEVLFGTLDAALIEFDSAIIADWKFGYIPVTPCKDNWQLRCYAAMIMQRYDVDVVQAYVIHPRIGQQTEACWTRAELEQFVRDIVNQIELSEGPGLQLAAGDHCTYCKAKPDCPEHRREFTELVQQSNREIDDPIVLSKYLELAARAKKWSDSVKHRARELAVSGVQIPGWYMQNRQGKMQVKDANAAYQALVIDGPLTHEQFMEQVQLTLGKLEDAYSRQNKVETGATLKDGKEWFKSQPWIVRGSDSQVLTKSRKQKED